VDIFLEDIEKTPEISIPDGSAGEGFKRKTGSCKFGAGIVDAFVGLSALCFTRPTR